MPRSHDIMRMNIAAYCPPPPDRGRECIKCCITLHFRCLKSILNIEMFSTCICCVLSRGWHTKFDISAVFYHTVKSLGCHNSICKSVFSLANADVSYQCHYSILAFTVSVILMSMDPYRHRSGGGKARIHFQKFHK